MKAAAAQGLEVLSGGTLEPPQGASAEDSTELGVGSAAEVGHEVDVHQFCERQLELLALESEAEKQQRVCYP